MWVGKCGIVKGQNKAGVYMEPGLCVNRVEPMHHPPLATYPDVLWRRWISSEHRCVYCDCSLPRFHGDTVLELIFMVDEGPGYG